MANTAFIMSYLFLLKFGFIKQVDKGWINTMKDLGSWRFKC